MISQNYIYFRIQWFFHEWLVQNSMIFPWFCHSYKFQELFMKFNDFSMILKQIRISMIFQELWEPWFWWKNPFVFWLKLRRNHFSRYRDEDSKTALVQVMYGAEQTACGALCEPRMMAAPSNERHGASFHRKLDCLLHFLFILTTKKTPGFHSLLPFCKRNTPVTGFLRLRGESFVNRWISMMTSSNGNIFRVTGLSAGIPLTKASDAEVWCFLWYALEQTVE